MADAIGTETGFAGVAAGASLYYEMAGTGPALVLLHEGIADSRMYDDQFGAFARHYRVVRYDLPGFGRSGAPDRAYTQHEVLHSLLRHLDIERTALLGMSIGGAIAIDFTLTYPDMVGALVLMAAGIGGYPRGESTLALAAPLVEAFKGGDFVRAIDLSVRLWVDGPRRAPEQVDSVIRERVRAMYTDVLRRSQEGAREPDPLDPPAYACLTEIQTPTLIVAGEGDLPDILAQADLLERSIAGARKVLLPEVAHVPNMERPDAINRLVLAFLDERYASL